MIFNQYLSQNSKPQMQRLKVRKKTTLLFLAWTMAYAFLLSGCGQETSASPAGIYVDSTTEKFIQKVFSETKECVGLEKGNFNEISMVIMPPTFPCSHYSNGCSGEYVVPNLVKLGNLYATRHELIHYFLYLNKGDLDANHESSLFNLCG